jgi:Kef-type K+ transport system membrane component KefB
VGLASLALLFVLGGISYIVGSRVRLLPGPIVAILAGAVVGVGGLFGGNLFWSSDSVLPPEPFNTFRVLGTMLLMWGAGAELQIEQLRRGRQLLRAASVGLTGAVLSAAVAWQLLELGILGNFADHERLALELLAAASAVPVLIAIVQEMGQLRHPRTSTALLAALIVDLLLVAIIPLVRGMVGEASTSGLVEPPWAPFVKTCVYLAAMLAIAEGPWRTYLQRAGRRFRASSSRREARLAVGFGVLIAVVSAAQSIGIDPLPAAFGWGIASKPVYFPDAATGENPFDLTMFPFIASYFVLAGSMLDLRLVSIQGVVFGLAMIVTKILGGAVAGREGLRVGTLLVPRGAVDLVLALNFFASGVLSSAGYAMALTMITVTTLIGSVLMQWAYRGASQGEREPGLANQVVGRDQPAQV